MLHNCLYQLVICLILTCWLFLPLPTCLSWCPSESAIHPRGDSGKMRTDWSGRREVEGVGGGRGSRACRYAALHCRKPAERSLCVRLGEYVSHFIRSLGFRRVIQEDARVFANQRELICN